MPRIKYKEAAKIEVKRGKPAIGKKPEKKELKRLYVKESKSIREVADVLGCSKDMVYCSLKEYGIERRPKIKRSRLRVYSKVVLKKKIETRDYRQVATELGVGLTTLRDYMKVDR